MPSIDCTVGLGWHAHNSPCQISPCQINHSTAIVLIHLHGLCGLQMEMETPSIKELQHMYSELDPGRPLQPTPPSHITVRSSIGHATRVLEIDLIIGLLSVPSLCGASANRHMGLDDKLEGSSERFMTQRVAVGHKVQQRAFVPLVRYTPHDDRIHEHIMHRRPKLLALPTRDTPPLPSSHTRCLPACLRPQVRQYAKFGIPPSLRPSLWRLMLGLPVEADNAQEKATFARLHEDVARSDNTPTHT